MTLTIVNTVKMLRKTNSINDKVRILQSTCFQFKALLPYVYDAAKTYNIKKIPNVFPGQDTLEDMIDVVLALLDRLIDGTGNDGLKADLALVLGSLTREDQEVLKSIVRKDLKCGVGVATVNAAFPGLIVGVKPMKATKWEPKRWRDDFYGSVKIDGNRAYFKEGKFFTTSGKQYVGFDHLAKILTPMGCTFDGELRITKLSFEASSGRIRDNQPTPEAKFFLFDSLMDSDMPFHKRYDHLSYLAQEENWSTSLLEPSVITLVKHVRVRTPGHADRLYQAALDNNFEGLMLKTANHEYQNRRSLDWFKRKPNEEEDCIIEGVYEGTEGTANEGKLGGVIITRENGVKVHVGGGWSENERIDMWKYPEKYIGKCIEVRYQNDTPDGSMRHPNIYRWRPDKD